MNEYETPLTLTISLSSNRSTDGHGAHAQDTSKDRDRAICVGESGSTLPALAMAELTRISCDTILWSIDPRLMTGDGRQTRKKHTQPERGGGGTR